MTVTACDVDRLQLKLIKEKKSDEKNYHRILKIISTDMNNTSKCRTTFLPSPENCFACSNDFFNPFLTCCDASVFKSTDIKNTCFCSSDFWAFHSTTLFDNCHSLCTATAVSEPCISTFFLCVSYKFHFSRQSICSKLLLGYFVKERGERVHVHTLKNKNGQKNSYKKSTFFFLHALSLSPCYSSLLLCPWQLHLNGCSVTVALKKSFKLFSTAVILEFICKMQS